MKLSLISIFLFLLFSANGLRAQTFEYGGGFQVYVMPGDILETNQLNNYNGPITTKKSVFAVLPTISGELSGNFPVFEREGFSIGLQPGLLANGMIRSGGFFIGTRGDAFITFRLGAGASYANYSEGKRYYGIGAGYSAYSVFNSCDDYLDKIFYAKPSVYLMTGIDNHTFKLFFQLVPYHSYYPSYTGNIPKITYWQLGMTWEGWRFFHEEE
jgi:hypothetical protein